MCHEATGANYDRPLFPEDVPLILGHYPNLDPARVDHIVAALTDAFWPKPAVLITFLELISRAKRNDTGYYPYPTIPFSAMDLETYERVQTKAMGEFHSVFEGFPLAERNKRLVDQALTETFGLKLVFFHDCGCSIVRAEDNPFDTEWYQEINSLRSLAEAVGTKVVQVTDFNDPEWVRRKHEHGLDMDHSETTSYERMFTILQSLSSRPVSIKQLASVKFRSLFPALV